jgi:hypothetical protein
MNYLDSLALNLVGPSRIVPEHVNRGSHVDMLRVRIDFTYFTGKISFSGRAGTHTGVETFQRSKLVQILLKQICELVQELATFAAGSLESPSRLEGLRDVSQHSSVSKKFL